MKHLLIADDDSQFRDRLARALRQRGFSVTTASTGHEAVAIAQDMELDAALLDLRMPALEGLPCLAKLLELHPHARIIILTGYGSIATAMEAVRLGAYDYLTKPTDMDRILEVLLKDSDQSDSNTMTAATSSNEPPSLERVEWEHIQRVLHDCQGNISEAARLLGLHRRSLQRKLQKYPPQR